MRILAAGDFHGSLDPLLAALDQLRPELLLSPGDWGDRAQVSAARMQHVLSRVPVLTIAGNHEDRPLLAELHNADGSAALLQQGELREIAGVRVAGISGIWAKTKLGSRLNARWEAALHRRPDLSLEQFLNGAEPPPYVTDDEIAGYAASLAGTEVDILLTHGCPIGLADLTPAGGRGGHRCFRVAFETIHPRVHVCGHLHRLQRADLPNGAVVLNTGSGAEGDGWLLQRDTGAWTATPVAAIGND